MKTNVSVAYGQLGKTIREYRINRGITQKQLATLLGHETSQFVSFMERGRSKVPSRTFGKISKILDIPETQVKRVVRSISTSYNLDLLEEVYKGRGTKK